jgi:hypothetical protein
MIKKLSIGIGALLLSASAQAMPTDVDQRVCKNWSNVAKSVMVYRQEKSPLSDAMDYVRKLPEGYHEFGFELALEAYQRRAFDFADTRKFAAADEFGEEILVACYVARKESAAKTETK